MRTLLLAICLGLPTGMAAQDVKEILSRMDKDAPNFRAMSADIQMSTYTAIITDTSTESGTLKMQRGKGGDVRAVIDFSGQSSARTISFLGKIVRIYYPNLRTYKDYDIGKNIDVLNQFLLLGFGSSGRDLAANYKISEAGKEKIGGQDTTKLVLTPKNPDVSEKLSTIEMWILDNASYPLQQKFIEPSGNYRTVTYSHIELKPSIKLDTKIPSGAKKT